MSRQQLYGKPQPVNFMVVLGGIILAGVAVYAVFMGVNSFGLPEQQGSAVILEKGYRAAGKNIYHAKDRKPYDDTAPDHSRGVYIKNGD